MAKNKKTFLIVSFLLLFGFFLRVILSPIIIKGDLLVHYEWSKVLYEEGLKGSYFRQGWIYSSLTQPPLMTGLFWFSRWLYESRYFLSISHNLFRLPPSSLIIWFDQNGEILLLRIWEILSDILSALLIYYLLLKISKNYKLAIFGLASFLFNPISIFMSAIWGQNDLLASFWVILTFFVFYKRWGKPLSPLFFTIGILIKPIVLILLPFYFIFLIKEWFNCPAKTKLSVLGATLVGGFLSLLLIFLLFIPFWDVVQSFLPYLKLIFFERIAPWAKGISRASNSAFNLYSLVFTIDRTPGSYKLLYLSLDQIGMGLFFLINFLAAYLWWKNNPRILISRVFWLSFIVYFLTEGTFLFKTGMLERYFLPAFIPMIVLGFLVKGRLKIILVLQNLIWFINLFYSFFLREIAFVQPLFRENNYLGVRLFSLLNILVFILIVFNLIKTKSFQVPATK